MTAGGGLRRLGSADRASLVRLQQAAYAGNRVLLGVEPLPLLADYDDILATMEVWGADRGGQLEGALILDTGGDDLLIWSVAADPSAQRSGIGNMLLAQAEQRARELRRSVMRLYTGQKLTANIAWYSRHGWMVERVEPLSDRTVVHMIKPVPTGNETAQSGGRT